MKYQTFTTDFAPRTGVLSPRLRTVAAIGTTGFVFSFLLQIGALLTNPEPMPYYPWLELPIRLPVTQPRLYLYPVSLTVGLWLWHITAPFVFFSLSEYFAGSTIERWLIAAPTVYMASFFLYCWQVWPLAGQTWILEPATSLPCYLYCYLGTDLWAGVTIVVLLIGAAAWFTSRYDTYGKGWLTVAFGVLSLPLGVPALYAGYRQLSE